MPSSTHASVTERLPQAAAAEARRGPAPTALRRFMRRSAGVLGAAILATLVLTAAFAGQLAPYHPLAQDLAHALEPPSNTHWLGTDEFGRDILSRIIAGTRIELLIGVGTVAMALVAGVAVGLYTGYYGGVVGEGLMRLMDILLAFPYLLLALMVIAILGPGLLRAMAAVSILTIPQFARLVQGLALTLRERQYVEASRAAGASGSYIVRRHLLVNMWGPIIVQATLNVGASIIAAAGLGFLGLGAQPPTPEWGAMLSTGRDYMLTSSWVATFPGLAILVTVIGFNLFGDGLRAAIGG